MYARTYVRADPYIPCEGIIAGRRATSLRSPCDRIKDGPLGLSPPGPHHTSLSVKFHPGKAPQLRINAGGDLFEVG